MQKPCRPVRVNKLPNVMQRRIAPAIKIFGILGQLFAMVTCLHQCKVYIKKKLLVWRAQKFNLLGCAKSTPTCTGQQTTLCLAAPYCERNRNFKNFGASIDMVWCLHQCNVYIERKLQVLRAQKCNFLVSAKTAPNGTGQQTTQCHAAPYRDSNENFRNFGNTFGHGNVFAPMQSYC